MQFDIWMLLAGVGILLFSMEIFESSLQALGGRKLKTYIEKYTKDGWSAIWTGNWATFLIQSSSIVSLLVLAFAGAGIMSLPNSIGVIIGANIGTTLKSLLIGLIGFGDVKISAFAFPMVALGGIGIIFLESEKWKHIAKLIVGFGLLFIGLDYMKDSVDALRDAFHLEDYQNLSLWAYGLIGLIVTIVVQSSSAVGVMTLAAIDGGIISFPASVAIVMGANIGTTVTAVIASLGGRSIKRQIALSQVLFNVGSGIIGVIFFWQYIWVTNTLLGFEGNPIMGNAVLNVIFNISTAILFGFFIKPFTRLIEWMIPTRKEEKMILKVQSASIGSRKHDKFATAQIYALHTDCKTLIDEVVVYNTYLFGYNSSDFTASKFDIKNLKRSTPDKSKHRMQYEKTKKIADIMLEYLLPLKLNKLPKETRNMTDDVEETIYQSLKSIKSVKNIFDDIQDIEASEDPALKKMYETMRKQAVEFYRHVGNIIDREYNKENFEELSEALKVIKANHKNFIESLSKHIAKKEIADVTIPTLINIDHYIYQSAKTLVNALQHTYLSEEDEKSFEKWESFKD